MAVDAQEPAETIAPKQTPGGPLPRNQSPIVPRLSISSRSLVAVIAIMTFLASLTTGAVMLVTRRA